MKTSVIKKAYKGAVKGQFRFILKASNGQTIATSHDFYHNKKDLIDTLNNNFSDFKIKDYTNEDLNF